MAQFADLLPQQVGGYVHSAVLDKTGLTGAASSQPGAGGGTSEPNGALSLLDAAFAQRAPEPSTRLPGCLSTVWLARKAALTPSQLKRLDSGRLEKLQGCPAVSGQAHFVLDGIPVILARLQVSDPLLNALGKHGFDMHKAVDLGDLAGLTGTQR